MLDEASASVENKIGCSAAVAAGLLKLLLVLLSLLLPAVIEAQVAHYSLCMI